MMGGWYGKHFRYAKRLKKEPFVKTYKTKCLSDYCYVGRVVVYIARMRLLHS